MKSQMLLIALLVLMATLSHAYRLGFRSTTYRPSSFRLNADMVECMQGDFDKNVIQPSMTAPVIVDFYADWCGPCKIVAPIFKKLAEDITTVNFVKVDTDVHDEMADKYGIQGLPLFALFIKGEVGAKQSGALTKDNLKKFIESNIEKAQV